MAVYYFYLVMLVIMGELVFPLPSYLQSHVFGLPLYLLHFPHLLAAISNDCEPVSIHPDDLPLQIRQQGHYHPNINISNQFNHNLQFLMALVCQSSQIDTILPLLHECQLQQKVLLQVLQAGKHCHYAQKSNQSLKGQLVQGYRFKRSGFKLFLQFLQSCFVAEPSLAQQDDRDQPHPEGHFDIILFENSHGSARELQFQSNSYMRKADNHRAYRPSQKSQDSKTLRPKRVEKYSPNGRDLDKENMHPNRPVALAKANVEPEGFRNVYYGIKDEKYRQQMSKYGGLGSTAMTSHGCREIEINLKDIGISKVPSSQRSTPKVLIMPEIQRKQPWCKNCGHGINTTTQRINQIYIAPGLTPKQYHRILALKSSQLQTIKQNLTTYQQQFKQLSLQVGEQHRRYYNQLLEVIQDSIKESQSVLAEQINQGERTITSKKEQIEEQMVFIRGEMERVVSWGERRVLCPSPVNALEWDFDVQRGCAKCEVEMELPVVRVHTDIPGILQRFKQVFNSEFSLKVLSSEEIVKYENRKKQQEKLEKLVHQNESYNSYRTSRQRVQEADLFCEEQLLEHNSRTNRTQDFSFEDNTEDDAGPSKGGCILELVEEEEVVSPVFKAI